jgi:hypothetical protein
MNDLYLNDAKEILASLENIELDIQERIYSEARQHKTWEAIHTFKRVVEEYLEKLEGVA